MNGTSGDVFSEYLVKCKMLPKNYLFIVLAVLAGLIITGAILLFIPGLLVLAIFAWFGVYFVIRLQKTEYEYIFTSGNLDIDQLSGDMRRKRKLEVEAETVQLIAPEKSESALAFAHGNYKDYDFSSHDPDSKYRYVIIGASKGENVRVLFEPNEKMLDNMWRFFPSKVKRA